MPQRDVVHGDGLAWLMAHRACAGASVLTSLPDVSELGHRDVARWRSFFVDAARACVDAVAHDGVAMFFQTDIHHDDVWIDKAALVHDAATTAGAHMLWHKIVLRAPAGNVTFNRPAYSHLLCFSRGLRVRLDRRTPDVVQNGKPVWSHGMGVSSCAFAVRQVIRLAPATTHITDPFCGRGTTLAVANALGLDAVGVELNTKRAAQSRALVLHTAAFDSR